MKHILERNVKLTEAITNNIRDYFYGHQHKVRWYGKDSASFEPHVSHQQDGIYLVLIFGIPMYIGESEVNVKQRITRWMKVLMGQKHTTEFHSLGNDLKKVSETYNIDPQLFIDETTVSFLSLSELKDYFSGEVFPNMTLFGLENLTIKDFEDKDVLEYFEQVMIEKIGPVSNRNLNGFSESKSDNNKKFHNTLKELTKKVA